MTYIDWWPLAELVVFFCILLHSTEELLFCSVCCWRYSGDVLFVVIPIVVDPITLFPLHCSHCCYSTFWWWPDTWYRHSVDTFYCDDEYCCVWYSFWWPMMTIDLMMTVFLMMMMSDVMIYIRCLLLLWWRYSFCSTIILFYSDDVLRYLFHCISLLFYIVVLFDSILLWPGILYSMWYYYY
jgi:hypothetical protein